MDRATQEGLGERQVAVAGSACVYDESRLPAVLRRPSLGIPPGCAEDLVAQIAMGQELVA